MILISPLSLSLSLSLFLALFSDPSFSSWSSIASLNRAVEKLIRILCLDEFNLRLGSDGSVRFGWVGLDWARVGWVSGCVGEWVS